jgi:hypothetical protein
MQKTKRLLGLTILLLIISTAQSQILISLLFGDKLNSPGVEFGIEGGINFSTISGFDTKHYPHYFNLGFYFDLRIKNQWYLYTGVQVKSSLGVGKLSNNDLIKIGATQYTGLDSIDLKGDYSHQLSYFIVPIFAKYNFKNRMYIEMGPQAGLMYRSWIQFDSEIIDKEAVIKEENKDQINRIDFGFTGGVGYKLMEDGWTIGIKYYYGLVNVYKNISGTKNSSIYIKVNIPIGAGKKKEKKEKIPKETN